MQRVTTTGLGEIGKPSLTPAAPVAPAPQTVIGDSASGISFGSVLDAPVTSYAPQAVPVKSDYSTDHYQQTVRFKQPNPDAVCFSNGPLTMGLQPEPVYMDELRALETRYPGVPDKLKSLDIEAANFGYTPTGSKALEAAVLADPPWPTTDYGSARANITAKSGELQMLDPSLSTQDASTYDFKAANKASSELLEKLDGFFPPDKFPGIAMSVRAKAPASLAKKMEKQTANSPDFTMAHLTDTVGARIDAPDLQKMGEVAKKLEEHYGDQIVAKSDYISAPGDNGYRALHYIIDIGGRMAEIQTSTTSLRTADLATHDTVYKPEFPVSPETAKELATAADRIMYLECLKAKGMK